MIKYQIRYRVGDDETPFGIIVETSDEKFYKQLFKFIKIFIEAKKYERSVKSISELEDEE